MTHGIFITGTDTGVGKTRMGTFITRLLTERGIRVCPRKPVESGCPLGPDGLMPMDAMALKEAARNSEQLHDICRYRFSAPVSPERAAILESTILDLGMLYRACLAGVDNGAFLLVEGAGGFYSPLARGALNADLASALGLPVLLVASDRLGTINHTLLTIEAIQMRGLPLAGVVLNQMESQTDKRMSNARDLERRLQWPVTRISYKPHPHSTLGPSETGALSRLIDAWLTGASLGAPGTQR